MRKMIVLFGNGESGATAIEYGLMAALVAAAIVTVMPLFQSALQTVFENVVASVVGPG